MAGSDASFPADATSIGVSALCLIHCVALPALAAFLPLAGQFAEWEWLHKAFVLCAIPISGAAMWLGREHENDPSFYALVISGLALLVAAAFWAPIEAHEKAVTVAGALCVAIGHSRRLFRRRRGRD